MPIDEDPIPRLKETLRVEILNLLGKYSQEVAAGAIGISQPRMSDLVHGRMDRFSLDKLIRILASINRRVDVTVTIVGNGQFRVFQVPPKG